MTDFLNNSFFAHRGFFNDKLPENSYGAFENAIKNGYGIELDLHILNDNTVVVFHDTNLKRMCNEDISLYELTGEEIKEKMLLNSNYAIPTLKSILNLVDGKVPLLIEIKGVKRYKMLCKKTNELLKNYKGKYAIQSLNPFALHYYHKLNKNATLVYLCSALKGISMGISSSKFIENCLKKILYNLSLYSFSKASYIAVKFDEITPKIIKKSKGNLLSWVIKNNNEEKIAKNYSKSIIFDSYTPSL